MLKKPIAFALSFSMLSSLSATAQDQESSVKYNHFYDFHRQRAAEIVQSMSLEEKIGQMTLVNMATIKRESTQKEGAPVNWDAIEKYHIGAVLADGDEMPETKNPSLSDWQTQMHAIGSHTVTLASNNKIHIRLLLGTDAVHGNQHVANAVIFPHNIGLGATHDPELIKQIAAWTAYDVKQSGFNWAYASTVAVAHDYRWGRTYESFSSDPVWIKRFAQNYIFGAQNSDDEKHQIRGVLTSTKHFIGDGNTDNGVDEGNVTVKDEKQFIQENYAGYEGAFSAGAGNVMVSYSSINGTPMSVNKEFLKTYLFAMDDSAPHFNGFAVSDYTAITKVVNARNQSFHETLAEAVNAGLDMIMVSQEDIGKASGDSDHSGNISAFQAALRYDHDHGLITDERINEAVSRILQVKLAMGLLDDAPQATLEPPEGNENEVALKAAEESLVLLKNSAKENQPVIPLTSEIKHIVLLGKVDDIGILCGGWNINWQGHEGNQYHTDDNASSILTGIKRIAPPGTELVRDLDEMKQLGSSKYTAKNTVVIALINEPPYAEFMGDVDNNNPNYNSAINPSLPAKEPTSLIMNFDDQSLEIIKALKERNIPIITVLVSGRPRIVNSSEDAPFNISDAFIAAWLPGTTGGEAIANAIFGKYRFVGSKDSANTLSVPWPKDMASIETGRLVCPIIRKADDPKPLSDEQTHASYDCGYGLKT